MENLRKIAVVYHSLYEHTEKVANHVLLGVKKVPGVQADLVKVTDEMDLDQLDDCDGLMFGSPTYMGSVSAGFKGFMDQSSAKWFHGKWKDKLAAGFTNSHSMSGDKLNTLIQLSVFAAQHGMNWVSLGLKNESGADDQVAGDPNCVNRVGSNLGLATQADNAPADVTPPVGDLKTAELFGERFAKAVLRWNAE